jgi:hypothetical protein
MVSFKASGLLSVVPRKHPRAGLVPALPVNDHELDPPPPPELAMVSVLPLG